MKSFKLFLRETKDIKISLYVNVFVFEIDIQWFINATSFQNTNMYIQSSQYLDGSVFARTQNDPDLRLKNMFKYVVSARFVVSFKILWSSKKCLDDK